MLNRNGSVTPSRDSRENLTGLTIEFITIDISAGKVSKTVKVPDDSDHRIFSPNHTFVVERGNGPSLTK